MFPAVYEFVRYFIWGELPEDPATPAVTEEPKPAKLIEHKWPFPSPEPTNVEYLLGEMIRGVEKEGEHVFYIYDGEKRRHLRTPNGHETVLARHIVWWMEGRKAPTGSIAPTCGEPKCIKISHLALKQPQIPYGPEPRKIPPATRVSKSEQPPAPPKTKAGKTKLERYANPDRNKCISRKAYFTTEWKAKQEAREISQTGRNKKQYAYKCDLIGCDGYHLTKINPKKYNKKKNKGGSW